MVRNYIFNLKGVELFTIPGFLNDRECEHICKLIESNHTRSSVAGSGAEKSSFVESRTSSSSHLNSNDEVVNTIDHRIAKELGIQLEHGEPLQGQLYLESQYYNDHQDYFTGDGYMNHCLASGQRTWTVMIYLNDVESGGHTEFPDIGKTFAPQKGTAVVWKNSDGTGREIPATLHSGRPVLKGKKLIITKWFREKVYNPHEDIRLADQRHKESKIVTVQDKNSNPVRIEFINGVPHARYRSIENIPRITREGFAKRKIPQPLFDKILGYYNQRRNEASPEFNPNEKGHLSEFIQSKEVQFPTQMIPLTDQMKSVIFDELEDIHREWSGREVHRTFCYGIRTYHRGAVLKKHTDGFETRIISSILNIDQDVDEPWALQIDDHEGKEHEVFLEPGEMCLYESAILMHGRVKPLKGNYFANLFVHYVNIT